VGLPAAAHSARPALGCPRAEIHVDAREIHVDAWASDVMAGAGGAAGPAPDERHQPPGKTIYIYCNYSYYYIISGSSVVKATRWNSHDRGFKPQTKQFFTF
jgi:hypothetical protein